MTGIALHGIERVQFSGLLTVQADSQLTLCQTTEHHDAEMKTRFLLWFLRIKICVLSKLTMTLEILHASRFRLEITSPSPRTTVTVDRSITQYLQW